ncbi:MAG TPA: adenylate/guanylate cyclase domain-containing protein, partial [Nevskiaceae bacterium]|nr:adenylate/guanylate cyclase domain-containing protein [Nevskiaceae bacterium]
MSKVRDFLPPGDFSALAFIPYDLVSLLALGMALSFIVADRNSLTSRYLALAFVFIGLSIDLNIVIGIQFNVRAALHGWFAAGEALASIALLEWIMRVRRTVPAGDLDVRAGDRVLRVGQLCAAAYFALAVKFPEIRLNDFLGALNHQQPFARPGFWLFAAPMFFSGAAGTFSILLLLNRHPDPPEKARVAAMALAIPFLMSSFVLPLFYNALPLML